MVFFFFFFFCLWCNAKSSCPLTVSFLSNRRSLLLAMAQRPKFYTNGASAQYGTRRLRWDGRSAYTIQEIRIGENEVSLSGFLFSPGG